MAHLMSNTDKNWPCVNCGSQGNIIREGTDPRLKCNSCNMMYDASQSEAALEAEAIPDGPPQLQEVEIPPLTPGEQLYLESNKRGPAETSYPLVERQASEGSSITIPRSPAYVFISRDRALCEFTTKRGLRAMTLQWETSGKTYNVYELHPRSVTAKIDIQ